MVLAAGRVCKKCNFTIQGCRAYNRHRKMEPYTCAACARTHERCGKSQLHIGRMNGPSICNRIAFISIFALFVGIVNTVNSSIMKLRRYKSRVRVQMHTRTSDGCIQVLPFYASEKLKHHCSNWKTISQRKRWLPRNAGLIVMRLKRR